MEMSTKLPGLQLAGHKDINVTMNYNTIYPQQAINAHRDFIARRRALRPADEYRPVTDAEWNEFRGHFARRKVALWRPATSVDSDHTRITGHRRNPDGDEVPEVRRRL